MSNFTYLSKGYNLKFTADNAKKILLSRIEATFEYIKYAKIMCVDFREVLNQISFQDDSNLCKRSDTFIYADPPYFNTEGWYTHNKNKEQDTIDCFNTLTESGIRFAMSEFDDPFILDEARTRDLNVHIIGERQNLKNRRTEILITNYESKQLKMDFS